MAANKAKPTPDFAIKGLTGLPVWAGRVYDEVLLDLQGERGRRILREMSEQDPIIGGTLLGIEMLARQVPWSVTPANDTPRAKKIADFVDECLTDMSPTFGSTLSEALSMLIYGWSWLEIIYKRREGLNPDHQLKSSKFDDGKIGWGGWAIRSQETLWRWEYENDDDTGELMGMTQAPPPNYHELTIPRSKSLHFVTRSRRENPEGISILRNAYRAWYMKKNIEIVEAIGIERDLAGLPVLWAPFELFSANASEEEKALFETLKKIVTSIKRDEQEGVLMPNAYDDDKNPLYRLELLSTGGDRQFDTNGVISRYDERIAMSMLADFILMGHQSTGSYALSDNKTGLFSMALSAIMDVIADEINAQAVPRLILLNGWPLDLVPSVGHGKIEGADLSKLGAFVKGLADAGMAVFPNPALEKHLLDLAGLPTDPGAGQLPMPQALVDELGNPVLDEQGNPVMAQLPAPPTATQPQLPAVAGGKPAATAVGPAATAVGPAAAAPIKPKPKPAKPATPTAPAARRAAGEPRTTSRHFTPLPVRLSKIRAELEEATEPEEYRELLATAMDVGKFSKLPQQFQDLIIEAESAE